MQRLTAYLKDVFRLFFPSRCAACGVVLSEGSRFLCPTCQWDMPRTGFSAVHDNPVARKFWGLLPLQEACSMFFFMHGSRYRSLIHGFKYSGQWKSGLQLGEMFGEELRKGGLYGDIDLVVPIPLHRRRLLKRGYNQSYYLAVGISRSLGAQIHVGNVVRSIYNRSQTQTKSRKDRWENVKSIFSVRKPQELAGRHILLVDDVLTTGATLISCAQAILRVEPDCRISIATLAVSSHELSGGKKET